MPLWSNILLLALCCAGSFFCSGIETGFVSWNPLKVSHRAARGHLGARWALYLMNRKDRVLAAVLIGNNLCTIGATLAFLSLYYRLDTMTPFNLEVIRSPESWFLTPVLIIFGEMVPKSLFRIYSFRLTMRAIPFLLALYFITLPFTWFYGIFLSLLKSIPGNDQSFLTKVREEMVLVASEGVRRGTLFDSSKDLIDGILRLKDKTIAEIVPAKVSTVQPGIKLFSTETVQETYAKLSCVLEDELPVYDLESGDIIGFVRAVDLVNADPELPLKALVKPIVQVTIASSLLNCLQNKEIQQNRYVRVTDGKGKSIGIYKYSDFFRFSFGITVAALS